VKKQVDKILKYFCDRCKKSFAESMPFEVANVNDNSVNRGASLVMPKVVRKKVSFKEMDFCGNCLSALSKWIGKSGRPLGGSFE
jgi:hypothetical protein